MRDLFSIYAIFFMLYLKEKTTCEKNKKIKEDIDNAYNDVIMMMWNVSTKDLTLKREEEKGENYEPLCRKISR